MEARQKPISIKERASRKVTILEKKIERSESEARKERVGYQAKSVLRDLDKLEPALLEDLTIGAETELTNREQENKSGITHIQDIADEIEEASKLWGRVSGLSTGYPSLDAQVGGLKAGELLLIGGETNNGKSALAQNIAVNVSKSHAVLFITLEMQKTEAGSRLKHMNGGSLKGLDLLFQTEYQIDYRHLDALFANGVAKGVKFVVLDYLQYMGRGMDLNEVAKMSKLMKAMALKYQVPFMVIVSLRKGEGGKFKRKWTDIEVEDLMGTSAIGYDADIAMVVSRKNLEGEFEQDRFFVKVIKSRNMPLDYNNRFLAFKWDATRISELPNYDWLPADDEVIEEVPELPLPYKD